MSHGHPCFATGEQPIVCCPFCADTVPATFEIASYANGILVRRIFVCSDHRYRPRDASIALSHTERPLGKGGTP